MLRLLNELSVVVMLRQEQRQMACLPLLRGSVSSIVSAQRAGRDAKVASSGALRQRSTIVEIRELATAPAHGASTDS